MIKYAICNKWIDNQTKRNTSQNEIGQGGSKGTCVREIEKRWNVLKNISLREWLTRHAHRGKLFTDISYSWCLSCYSPFLPPIPCPSNLKGVLTVSLLVTVFGWCCCQVSPFKGRNVRDRQEREGRQSSRSSRGQGHTHTRVACLNGSLKICVQTSFSQAFILSRFYLSFSVSCLQRKKGKSLVRHSLDGVTGVSWASTEISLSFFALLICPCWTIYSSQRSHSPEKGKNTNNKKERENEGQPFYEWQFVREWVRRKKAFSLSWGKNEWLSPVCCKRKRWWADMERKDLSFFSLPHLWLNNRREKRREREDDDNNYTPTTRPKTWRENEEREGGWERETGQNNDRILYLLHSLHDALICNQNRKREWENICIQVGENEMSKP